MEESRGVGVALWGPGTPRDMGEVAHLLLLPREYPCVPSAHGVHFTRLLVAGLSRWLLGSRGEVEGSLLEGRQWLPWWSGESHGLVPGPAQVLTVRGVLFQKAGVSTVPELGSAPVLT